MTTDNPKPATRKSGTANWHMSSQAVTIGVFDIARLSEHDAHELMVKVRFGGGDRVQCPHCMSVYDHYFRVLERRWKCKSCGKTFSVLSGTVFSGTRMPLQELLGCLLLWVNSAGGQPSLELRRHLNKSYNATFMIQSKMREALIKGFNVGFMTGDLEIDGSHQSGKRSAEKRGKPQVSLAHTTATPIDELLSQVDSLGAKGKKLKPTPGALIEPEFGCIMPENRRILINVRQRSGEVGRGAFRTKVAIAKVEDSAAVEAVCLNYLAAQESRLNSDASPAYTKVAPEFRSHSVVVHSKELSGPSGENNNQAEEFAWRQDRAEKGTYLNIEPKYLLDYAVESAFKSDTRRMSNEESLKLAFKVACSVGESEYWRGFTHGKHSGVELLILGAEPTPSSGKKKSSQLPPSVKERPPR